MKLKYDVYVYRGNLETKTFEHEFVCTTESVSFSDLAESIERLYSDAVGVWIFPADPGDWAPSIADTETNT